MKKIQKNGMNKRNSTRRRRRKVPKGKKRNGQMKILVNDLSMVGAAEIYGQSHYPGGKIPGYKVLVVDDLMKAYRKIGVKKAIIYPVPTEMAA